MVALGQTFIDSQKSALLNGFRRRRYRTMEQFARDEIVITTGPFPGRFLPERQPHMVHWYRLVDSGLFSELLATGPSQSGKTLNCFVVPLLYHLFEIQETVIAAVPDGDMIADKWSTDILPVIEASRYRDLLPTAGAGSKGGLGIQMRFRHGPILRWMTAGGDDKRRAGFTSRVICFTETDGFDDSSETSAEGTKLEQIEARARSFPLARRRIYKECTVSLRERHTWHTYEQRSTSTRLVMPCQHCGEYVLPERDHLVGWRGADSAEVARAAGQLACPSCGEVWTEAERRESVRSCVPLHLGQEIGEDGKVKGELPDTRTLGFRWTASHNLLLPAGDIAADEWAAERASDEDAAQRKMCQFVWAVPYTPLDVEQVALEPSVVESRATGLGRGQKPSGTRFVSIGIDVNQAVLHWTAVAFCEGDRAVVIDYGKTGVKWRQKGFKRALDEAIRHLHAKITDGWSDAAYDRVNVDARYKTDDVIASIKGLNDRRWRAHMGLGKGQYLSQRFHENESPEHDKKLVWVGERSYEQVVTKHRAILQKSDANHWKGIVQERLALDGNDGSISLFAGADGVHTQYARHITSEREEDQFDPKRGVQKVFIQIRSANHWLDSTYMALTGGHRLGWLVKPRPIVINQVQSPAPTGEPGTFQMPEFGANPGSFDYDYGA